MARIFPKGFLWILMKNRGTDLVNYAESADKKMPGCSPEFDF